jgi:hypothetical protein
LLPVNIAPRRGKDFMRGKELRKKRKTSIRDRRGPPVAR